jgi:4,5-dihydroxyphthalate decarboxylase
MGVAILSAEFTIAMDRYDRHMPFFDHTVSPQDGFNYKPLQVGQSDVLRDGTKRHENMIHHRAYDVSEFSMSTFLMAHEKGLPLIGIPIFPRRLFSQSCMFVRADSDIIHPRDLIGRTVGISSFQTTLSLLAKGDLKFEYQVPWEKINWCLTTDEKVPFTPKVGVNIERAEKGQDLGLMLRDGLIDAVFMPHPPASIMYNKVKTRRLFPDTRQEELNYFNRNGYWPIMHVVVAYKDFLAKHRNLPLALMKMFEQAHHICTDYYSDPNWSIIPTIRHEYESSLQNFAYPWVNGFLQNRKNIERFISYSYDQGLISRSYNPEDLFDPSTLNT